MKNKTSEGRRGQPSSVPGPPVQRPCPWGAGLPGPAVLSPHRGRDPRVLWLGPGSHLSRGGVRVPEALVLVLASEVLGLSKVPQRGGLVSPFTTLVGDPQFSWAPTSWVVGSSPCLTVYWTSSESEVRMPGAWGRSLLGRGALVHVWGHGNSRVVVGCSLEVGAWCRAPWLLPGLL